MDNNTPDSRMWTEYLVGFVLQLVAFILFVLIRIYVIKPLATDWPQDMKIVASTILGMVASSAAMVTWFKYREYHRDHRNDKQRTTHR